MIKPPGYFVCIYLEYIYIYISYALYTQVPKKQVWLYYPDTLRHHHRDQTARKDVHSVFKETTSIDDLKLGW